MHRGGTCVQGSSCASECSCWVGKDNGEFGATRVGHTCILVESADPDHVDVLCKARCKASPFPVDLIHIQGAWPLEPNATAVQQAVHKARSEESACSVPEPCVTLCYNLHRCRVPCWMTRPWWVHPPPPHRWAPPSPRHPPSHSHSCRRCSHTGRRASHTRWVTRTRRNHVGGLIICVCILCVGMLSVQRTSVSRVGFLGLSAPMVQTCSLLCLAWHLSSSLCLLLCRNVCVIPYLLVLGSLALLSSYCTWVTAHVEEKTSA